MADEDHNTAQGFARSSAEDRAAAVETMLARLPVVDPSRMTTREKLERGLTVREDVSVTTEHETNLKWVGVDDEAGTRTRQNDPPTSVHIGRIDVYFDNDAVLALCGSKGVYCEHAAIVIGNVPGFKRPESLRKESA